MLCTRYNKWLKHEGIFMVCLTGILGRLLSILQEPWQHYCRSDGEYPSVWSWSTCFHHHDQFIWYGVDNGRSWKVISHLWQVIPWWLGTPGSLWGLRPSESCCWLLSCMWCALDDMQYALTHSPLQEYATIFAGAGNNPGEKSLEDKFFEKEVCRFSKVTHNNNVCNCTFVGGNQHQFLHATIPLWSVLFLHSPQRAGMQECGLDSGMHCTETQGQDWQLYPNILNVTELLNVVLMSAVVVHWVVSLSSQPVGSVPIVLVLSFCDLCSK